MDKEFIEGLQKMIVDGVVEGTVEGIIEELNKVIEGKTNKVSNKRFMNKKEVTKFVGISYPTLDKWIDSGLEYSLISGTQYVFDVEDVVKFIKEHKVNYLENI